jgi:hypothetical protein
MLLEKRAAKTEGDLKVFPHRLDISVGELEVALLGVEYPAQKRDLIARARINGASDDIMTFLHLLPEDKYPHFYDIAFMAWSFLIV